MTGKRVERREDRGQRAEDRGQWNKDLTHNSEHANPQQET